MLFQVINANNKVLDHSVHLGIHLCEINAKTNLELILEMGPMSSHAVICPDEAW